MVQSCHLGVNKNCSPQLFENLTFGLKVRWIVSPMFYSITIKFRFFQHLQYTLVEQYKSQYSIMSPILDSKNEY